MNWHYESNGQSQGPISDEEIARLVAAGTINDKTLVWREGLAAWSPLGEVWQAPPAGTPPASAEGAPPAGWIRCTATGKSYPPNEIVYIAGKPYSLEAKDSVVQGVIQTGAVPGDFAARTGPAWEQRQELGLVTAAWQTAKAVLLNPVETFASMKREGGLGNPLLYMVIVGSIAGVISIGYQIVVQLSMNAALSEELRKAQANAPFGMAFTSGMMIGMAVFMPLLIVIGTFIMSGVVHLSLMICGGAKQPFETTFRAYCYANGAAAAFQVIPFCGAYITAIWGLVALCIGIAKSHEIGGGRAVLAVLLPLLLCCGGAVTLALVFGMTAAMAGK